MILGYPALQAINPKINWTKGELKGTFTTSLLEASKAKQSNKITYTPNKLTQKFNQFKLWINHTMVATQLTIKKAPKKEQTWQEQVSKEYHKYHKVFSEQAA
jgi:hypothetical protein